MCAYILRTYVYLQYIAMQIFQPLKEELLNLERGVVMHDGSIATDVLVVAPVHMGPGTQHLPVLQWGSDPSVSLIVA